MTTLMRFGNHEHCVLQAKYERYYPVYYQRIGVH